MKNLFKAFSKSNNHNKDNDHSADKRDSGRDAKGKKTSPNAEVIPGKLFEHYHQVLHGTDEILRNIK